VLSSLWLLLLISVSVSSAQVLAQTETLSNASPEEHIPSQTVTIKIAGTFSQQERGKIMEWLGGAMEGVRRVYGEWPQERLIIRVERSGLGSSSNSPVPWGQVVRGRGSAPDEVLLQLNLGANTELAKDWTVYHELSHTLIPYKSGARWLSEGLASYYQNIVQARLGLLGEQQMWAKLYAGFKRGAAQNASDRRTLQQVSDGAGQYMRIHWHGALYWLTVDADLRRSSANRRSLDGALLALKRCCEQQSLRPRQLVSALDQAYETDLFTRHYQLFSNARSLPDFDKLLASIGVNIEGDKVLLPYNNTYSAQRQVSRGIYLGAANNTAPLPDFAAIRARTGVGAVGWAAVERGVKHSSGAIGHYSLKNLKPVTDQSMFRIGSLTKTLLTIASLTLEEQGRLNLDAPLLNLAPDAPLENHWPDRPISMRMLLEHSAGLADISGEEMNYLRPLSLVDALRLEPANRVTLWRPGEHSSYSNAGAGLVSYAIQNVTNRNFDNWFDQFLQSKLGMKNSTIRWSQVLQKKLVTGYNSDLISPIPYWHTLFRAFGGVNTTPADMARMLQVFTNSGRIQGLAVMDKELLQAIQAPKTNALARAGIIHGRSLGARMSQQQGNWIVSHNGDADGYLSRFAYAPATERAYFVVINAYRDDLLTEFVTPLDHWLLEGASPNRKAPRVQQAARSIAQLVGNYEELTQRFPSSKRHPRQLTVEYDGSMLYWRRANSSQLDGTGKHELVHVGNHRYRYPAHFAASTALSNSAEGETYLHGPFGNYRKLTRR